jgi:hypothetical protein
MLRAFLLDERIAFLMSVFSSPDGFPITRGSEGEKSSALVKDV